jgi:ABC-type branched-subunit amino acid transport system substrate-binding protein
VKLASRTLIKSSTGRVAKAIAIAGAAALVVALTGCTADEPEPPPYVPPPGVTDTEIIFGTHQPLTGPAPEGYAKIAPATQAYFNYVNDAGGVHGRTITYLIEDDAYDPATTATVVRKLVEEDKVFAVLNGLGTPTHSTVLDYLKDKQIPDLFVASGATAWNQPARYPGTFAFQPDHTTEGKIIGNYLKTAPEYAGRKVCHFGQDDDFGNEALAGLETGLGGAVAARQTYIASNRNVAPQIGALQTAGCEVIVLATIPDFTALAVGTAAQLSYRPMWVASTVGSDYTTLASYLGPAAPLLDGLVSFGYLPALANTEDPWINLFMQINDEYNDGAVFDGNVLYGMALGYLVVQVLQKAGREITVDNLIGTIETGGFQGPGLAPFAYSGTSHAGYTGGRMSRVSAGVQDYFGPVYVTDAGSAPVAEHTEPAAIPPSDGVPTG